MLNSIFDLKKTSSFRCYPFFQCWNKKSSYLCKTDSDQDTVSHIWLFVL